MSDLKLKGKRALVGGGTGGLGKAIAMELANQGAEVIMLARNEKKCKSVVSELSNPYRVKHDYLVVDFSDFESYQKIMTEFFAENHIDILVNNTQGPPAGTVNDFEIEDYQKAFDLLFKVNCFNSLNVVKGMAVKGWGRIINLASVTVKEPLPNLVLSNTMRTALQSWNKSLADSYADKGVTVNTILTGYFYTERIKSLLKTTAEKQGILIEKAAENMLKEIPVRRFGKPEEYGKFAAFLASDDAAFITGASIPLDGGMIKGL